jgi:osmotically inducible protein OsmC
MKRTATANWKGTGKEGKGFVSTASNNLKNAQYSFSSRFENATGTNPEELVAAAHSSCFAMKLSFVLNEAGFTADELMVTCTVNLESGAIINSHLKLVGKVPGISKEKFEECAANAKANCPISLSLSTNITFEAELT